MSKPLYLNQSGDRRILASTKRTTSATSILKLEPTPDDGKRLLKRYQKIRAHLLLFLTDETVLRTNNASEQALRWSVVFRTVTHGFRSDWGSELFALVRSIVNTAKRQGISAFDAIFRALTSQQHDWLLG
ncbi:MAG: transposase [Leptolyngbyaceae bacterium]|nr:transposase [Leptolyngbyaceae bacterium]